MGSSKGSSQRGPNYSRIEGARSRALEQAFNYRQEEARYGAQLQRELLAHSLGEQANFYRNLAPDLREQERFQQSLWGERATRTKELTESLARDRAINQRRLVETGAREDRAGMSLASGLAREENLLAHQLGLEGARVSSGLSRDEARLASELRRNEAQEGKDITKDISEFETKLGRGTLELQNRLRRGLNLQESNLRRQEGTHDTNLQLALRRDYRRDANRNQGLSQFGLNQGRGNTAPLNYLNTQNFGITRGRNRRRKGNGFD